MRGTSGRWKKMETMLLAPTTYHTVSCQVCLSGFRTARRSACRRTAANVIGDGRGAGCVGGCGVVGAGEFG